MDKKKPTIVSCPSDIDTGTDIEEGSAGVSVTWLEPSVTDESGNVTLLVKSHAPGDIFGSGNTTVTYLYADPSNNLATCTFQVVTRKGKHRCFNQHDFRQYPTT